MFFGVVGAAVQFDFRRLLSFHIISQIGYMLMGLGLFTTVAISGSIFHIAHNMIAKTNLFLISGFVYHLYGTFGLKKLGGMYKRQPFIAFLFFVPAFALAGIPPLSGFWSKFLLVKAGLQLQGWIIVGVSLFVSLLTLFSMTKIWAEVFWKPYPSDELPLIRKDKTYFSMLTAIIFMVAVNLFISFYPEPLLNLVQQGAAQLLDPSIYIQAVLGG
jgi:multicomponent Na+:H+ antiporter subunit D